MSKLTSPALTELEAKIRRLKDEVRVVEQTAVHDCTPGGAMNHLLWIDTETGGLRPGFHSLLSFALLKSRTT